MRSIAQTSLSFLLAVVLAGLTLNCGGQPSAPPPQSTAPAAAASQPAAEQAAAELRAKEQQLAEAQQKIVEREAAVAEREAEIAKREAAPASTPRAASPRPATAPPPSRAPKAPAALPASQQQERPAAPPARPPAAAAPRVNLTVPAQTEIGVEFLSPLSSETSHVGDRFKTRVTQDILVDGTVAIPAGSEVSGEVTEVQASKKIGGQAKIALTFDRLELPVGDSAPIHATLVESGKSQRKKDAATIGGAAAGGAVLGKVLGKDSDKALIGAILGAAVGTAVAAKNAGDPVTIGEGTVVVLKVKESLRLYVEKGEPHFDDSLGQ